MPTRTAMSRSHTAMNTRMVSVIRIMNTRTRFPSRPVTRHTHWHRHAPLQHAHGHYPDAHHLHAHPPSEINAQDGGRGIDAPTG